MLRHLTTVIDTAALLFLLLFRVPSSSVTTMYGISADPGDSIGLYGNLPAQSLSWVLKAQEGLCPPRDRLHSSYKTALLSGTVIYKWILLHSCPSTLILEENI